jgi:WS/DGAT/MGAT family acyltransferase
MAERKQGKQRQEMVFEDRMGDTDALMWEMERDPALRSTITSVWVLDRLPDETRMEQEIDRAARTIPRLMQRVVSDPLGIANPAWELDPSFDLRFHLRHLKVPRQGTLRDLFDMAEPIAMQAFDRDRPLWEFYLIDGLEGGRAAAIMKLHHAISDGVGLVRMTESMVDRSPEPRQKREALPPLPKGTERSGRDRLVDALGHEWRRGQSERIALARAAARGLGRFVRDPQGTVQGAREMLGSLQRLLGPVNEQMSPLMDGRSIGVQFHGFVVPLEQLKRAGKAAGGSINDAFVAAVGGGMRLYHEHHGAPVEELRMAMPINLRDGEKSQKAGNQFVPARFPIPVAEPDPIKRIKLIHSRVLEQRGEPALPSFEVISGVLNRFPPALTTPFFGAMMKAVDFTTSNVPGPRFPVYMSGAKIEQMFPFGPTQGAANITAFSYDGQFQVGLNADPAAIADAPLLAECLQKGFGEVMSIV